MAEDKKNTSLISKNNAGFPEYLDFDRLRTEGIDYLGRLSGKIWTDHNVHDPGITILEILCYALLDLGYRTNLPPVDIFTRDPEDLSPDNNFYTPGQILTCNPLTIPDFRKLLIDIKGIKNAWLNIATDQIDFCRPGLRRDPQTHSKLLAGNLTFDDEHFYPDYLNGLYHVYIDLEEDIDIKYNNNVEGKEKFLSEITASVKNALMAHRNLCEDFIDITVLCKQEVGVCAGIELDENADVEQIYIAVVEALRKFFSPAPQFYTLEQLLEKEKPIDEIFSGRPYNLTESHGFVDTVELKQITLRKEIHLSDVYHTIFQVKGVKAVNDLRLQICKGHSSKTARGWRYHIPENHVPEFSLECSGFQFSRNGRPVFVDIGKFEGLFTINFSHNGKIKYQIPSPYLDSGIPQGVYRNDLDSYYSIQNEFPNVYGIAKGGLPENTSNERKAKALQLKAWLLFFDQLLANYLAQLKGIPALFALSSPDETDLHTYLINQLTNVPDHQKLVRFNLDENQVNKLGSEGSILVVPVEKKKWTELVSQGQHKTISLDKLMSYSFQTLAELDIATSQLKNDLYFERYQCEFVVKKDECVYYYMLTSSEEFVLISKKYFTSISEAKEHANSVHYIGTFEENYRSFITSGDEFSFDIELTLMSFSKYLQLIVEDKSMFLKRRQVFLDHLLARFAEQFTDFALLSFGFQNSHHLQFSEINHKENYLSHYPDLSSNRGKAYDYLANNWYSDNVSGFEKKVKSLSGMDNDQGRSLCNFQVAKYNKQYEVNLKIADSAYFSVKEKFDTKEEGQQAAMALFEAMKERKNYGFNYVVHDKTHQLVIRFGEENHTAVFPLTYDTEQEAMDTADRLSGLFDKGNPEEAVFISSYIYTPELKDSSGLVVRRSLISYPEVDEAKTDALKTVKKIDNRKQWQFEESAPKLGRLYHINYFTDHLAFINTDAFKIDINNTIIYRPGVFTYDLLDQGNIFKFNAVGEFNTARAAKADAFELLALLADASNYQVNQDPGSDKFRIQIVDNNGLEATDSIERNSREEALEIRNRILDIVNQHRYYIDIEKHPNRWMFHYQMGYEQSNLHTFESVVDYDSWEKALQASTLFLDADPDLKLEKSAGKLTLTTKKDKAKPVTVMWMYSPGNDPAMFPVESVEKLLAEKKEIVSWTAQPDIRFFAGSVRVDAISRQGLYVYRLVDKDRVPAFFTYSFKEKESAKNGMRFISDRFRRFADYLKICMGGEHIIHKVKDPNTRQYWYHYQIKSIIHTYQSGKLAGQSLVLFESTKGYRSSEDAEDGFKENYLYILHLATHEANYKNKISLEDIHDSGGFNKVDGIAFVPQSTTEELGHGDDLVIKELIHLARSYPIRMVKHGSTEFYKLFPCEEKNGNDEDDDICKKENEPYVYYFIAGALPGEGWQSVRFYDSPDEAVSDFHFSLMLLQYPGNYYVDCDPCLPGQDEVYHVYIREVLAESAERFESEAAAWGQSGVQKFICISQSEDSFYTYLRKRDCCYSFYVACRDSLIYHPCKYDTQKKRDKALLKLYQSLKDQIRNKSWEMVDSRDGLLLLNGSGKSFALAERISDNYCRSDLVAVLSEFANIPDHYHEKEGRIILTDDRNNALAISTDEGISIAEWKSLLRSFICLYPIVKNKGGNDRTSYCIEIKLAGFNTCQEDLGEVVPCGCGSVKETGHHDCYIAWKSRCCYDNCQEAEEALRSFLILLQQYEFYQPVFDCECHSYGITLQVDNNSVISNENIEYTEGAGYIRHWHNSEIIAINPQCYPCKEDACEAVSQAKQLINNEGLHVVEHILLRPRCYPEDCRCREGLGFCDKTDCEFNWKTPEKDPCIEDKDKDICFIPGTDPYSFIATVVLPAWSERFRSKNNRLLLENIIYREAPAHVLVRILWLAPHDFCCFESKFRKWNHWLAQKKTCIDRFSVCDLIEFLFRRNYECLTECEVCQPCYGETEKRQPCFNEKEEQVVNHNFQDQINELFCWRERNCKEEYNFVDCDSSYRYHDDENPETSVILSEHPVIRTESESEPAGEDVVDGERSKPQVANARLMKYKTIADTISGNSKNNPIAIKAQRFMADPEPEYKRLSNLIAEILQNKPPETKRSKILTGEQKLQLIENTVCYWLDRHSFKGENRKELYKLKYVVKKLNTAKVNPDRIANYWNVTEIKQVEKDLDEEYFERFFFEN